MWLSYRPVAGRWGPGGGEGEGAKDILCKAGQAVSLVVCNDVALEPGASSCSFPRMVRLLLITFCSILALVLSR